MTGPIALPELVERLQSGGEIAVAQLSEEELDAIIDDLTMALESDVIRDLLSKLVARIDRQKHRTFRRIVEIARQDDERTPILLAALKHLGFSGEPTDEEFAWLVHVMSTNSNAMARLDAFDQSLRLALQPALQGILEAVATIHPDEAIRAQMSASKGEALASNGEAVVGLVTPDDLASDLSRELDGDFAVPAGLGDGTMNPDFVETDPGPLEAAAPAADPPAASADAEAAAWMDYEQPAAPSLTVRTMLRNVEAESGTVAPESSAEPTVEEAVPEIAAPPDAGDDVPAEAPSPAPEGVEPLENSFAPSELDAFSETMAPEPTIPPADAEPTIPPDEIPADLAAAPDPNGDAAAWSTEEEKPPERLTVRTLLRSIDPSAQLGPGGQVTTAASEPEPMAPIPDPATLTDAEPTPADVPPPELVDTSRETVRTTLAEIEDAPHESVVAPPVNGTNGVDKSGETVETMLRSLETVKLSLRELETAKSALQDAGTLGPERTAPPAAEAAAKAPAKWAALDLKPLSAPERARSLAKVRRELAPEERRGFLSWLFERENDVAFGASIRREILEFAFERTTFLAFDAGTRSRLGRWIREKAAGDALTPAAVLAALRRASWIDGEPPHVDTETRPIVDAASGMLARVPSEERVALLTRDFTAWLFAVREFEDKEVLDKWVRDEHPGVAEGIFRALAAMDASASKLGVTEGPTAYELALGLWDRCDPDRRLALAQAIAGGWSKGFVLDRRRFFDGFWKRYQLNPSQRESILVALASFEREIEDARRDEEKHHPAPDAEGFTPPPESPEQPHESAPAPAAAPANEDSAPTEEKVLASLVGARKLAKPAAATASISAPTAAPAAPKAPAPVAAPVAKPSVAPAAPPPAAAAVEEREPTDPGDDKPDEARYYERQRRELERVMRQMKEDPSPRPPTTPSSVTRLPAPTPAAAKPAAVTPPAPTRPPTSTTAPRASAPDAPRPTPFDDPPAADEDVLAPDEGEAFLTDEERASSAPKRLPTAKPAPAPVPPKAPPNATPSSAGLRVAAPAGGPDDEVVLSGEPLKTLSEYTGFLRALSGGTSIDELLGRHGMDYRQYAACMTSWGKLLQSRPDLALRMGQLLRSG